MALDAGILKVTLQYAKDLKDCDWFGRQDPYARLRVGSQERRSRVAVDGGRNPVWDETFEFSVINENTLDLILMDQDTLKFDDLIGSASVSLARVREQGFDRVQAPVSNGKNVHKQHGFVQLALSFVPNSRLGLCPSMSVYGAPPYGAAPMAFPPAPSVSYGHPPPPAAAQGYGTQPPPQYAYPYSYGPSPSYSYSPSMTVNGPAPTLAPVPAAQAHASAPAAPSAPLASSQAWPPPAYSAPPYSTPAPSYYPAVPRPPLPPVQPPPAPVPAYGSYSGAAQYYRS